MAEAKHTPGPMPVDPIRAAYEKHYPEFKGVASLAVRNHYAVFKTGWYAHAAAIAKATGSAT